MALRLGDHVVCGELFNTRYYSTHGWLKLRGRKTPIHLELTGNPDPDLTGGHIRFEVTEDRAKALSDIDLSKLAPQQIGPTGTMTAARRVQASEGIEDKRSGHTADEPPMQSQRCLYLEWFSQNGQVVVELVDPRIEFVEDEDEDSTAATEADADSDHDTGFDESFGFDDDRVEIDDPFDVEPDEDDDPYGLVPDELQNALDAQAMELDRATLKPDEDTARVIRELELMDDLIENSDSVPVGQIFNSPVKLPKPDNLTEGNAEGVLKQLLAELALYGVALNVCEHFTPLAAYRLLVERICHEDDAFPDLRQTQWVQYYSTWEYCKKCEAEVEEEWEKRQKEEDGGEDEEKG